MSDIAGFELDGMAISERESFRQDVIEHIEEYKSTIDPFYVGLVDLIIEEIKKV